MAEATPQFSDSVYSEFYQGWGRTEAEADWKATGRDKWQGFQRDNDPGFQAQQALEESRKRARGELEGVKPKIAEIFESKRATLEGEIEPTIERYNALLEEVTRREKQETTSATLATGRELGRRGVTAASGLGERTINEALSPILRFFTGQAKDVGFERESSLRSIQALISGLGEQQSQQEIGIASQLANIESNFGASAAQVALQNAQLAAQTSQNSVANELARQQQQLLERQQTLAEDLSFPDLQREQLLANIARTQQLSAGGGTGGGTGAINFQDLFTDFFGGE